MKALKILFASFLLLLYSGTTLIAQQQENQLFYAIKHIVKPDKYDEYKEAFKQLADACKEHQYSQTYYAWRSEFPVMYYFFPVNDYNHITANGEEIWKIIPQVEDGFGSKLMTNIDSYDSFFLRAIDSLSYSPAENVEGLIYAEWLIMYNKMWTGQTMKNTFHKVMQNLKEVNHPYPIGRVQADVGMAGPAMITIFWGKDQADLIAHRTKGWESFGDEEQKMINDLQAITRKQERISFWYQPDLSYIVPQ